MPQQTPADTTPDRAAIVVTCTVTIRADDESITLHPADGVAVVTDRYGDDLEISLDLLRAAAAELANLAPGT